VLIAQRYRLQDSLGRGGMGEVWRATDELLGREVAVKLLHPCLAGEAATERFRIEARAAGRVTSPHVVAVHDFGSHDQALFLVMELVDGHSLADELAQIGVMGRDRATDIVAQAAAGLAAAHQRGVVHRDVKPGNLLLTTDATVKIADFGIARLLFDTSEPLTMPGEVVGTSYYLAPERALGHPAGPAADVYSLGCVLYQLVTGHPPFQGDAPAAVAYQHVKADPVPPGELGPQLAGEFEDHLLQMLAKDPLERPSAQEIAGWTPAAPAPTKRLAVVGLPTDQQFPETSALRPGRSPAHALTAAAAAIVGTAVVAGAMLGTGGDDRPTGKAAVDPPAATPSTVVSPTPTPPRSQKPSVPPKPASTRPTSPSTGEQTVRSPTIKQDVTTKEEKVRHNGGNAKGWAKKGVKPKPWR